MSGASDIETKLAAARTRLVLEHPFIGSLLMHLPLRRAARAWCPTFGSDGRAFYFNPHYIDQLDFSQTQFVLAHEALHCALGHFARRGSRTIRRWDAACDYAVNLLLTDEGMKPAPGALLERQFRGLSAEDIYSLLGPDTAALPLDRHLAEEAGQGSGPRPLTAHEREAVASEWRTHAVSAAQQARRAGRLPTSWQRLVEELVSPTLPWRELLARYMLSTAREDYGYERPSRREGSALLPRPMSRQVDVYLALDTSGSIAAGELAAFAVEVGALQSQIRARVTLFACDERLDEHTPWTFEPWEQLTLPTCFKGGGGTSFIPVFDWIAREHARPDLLVYFTDAEGEFPEWEPEFPVVWLVKGRRQVPWGERIQLNWS